MSEAFKFTSGPRRAKMLILGEAWGEGEESLRRPFVGESGKELWRMLGEALPEEFPELHQAASAMHRYGLAWVKERDAWLEATGILLTNVLAFRPPDNKLENLCCDKKEIGGDYTLPPISKGKYLPKKYLGELDRVQEEIELSSPNLVLLLGNTACWAGLQATNIGSIRGTVAEGHSGGPARARKCLPTYHPAGVLRNWSWRPIVVADLMKAWRQARFPEIVRPKRKVVINPSLAWLTAKISALRANPPKLLGADIETAFGQIKCISFAPSRGEGFTIPFFDPSYPGWNYWPSAGEELRAWELAKELLEDWRIPKVGQNFLYDLQYIMRVGIRPRNVREDTMLLHHSHFPEMQKGLGFLGSIYTDEASWKLMNRHKPDTEKRDE